MLMEKSRKTPKNLHCECVTYITCRKKNILDIYKLINI